MANNGWHLEPFTYWGGSMTVAEWALVALAAWWGLRVLRRWWHGQIEQERLEREDRQRRTQSIVDIARRRAEERARRDGDATGA